MFCYFNFGQSNLVLVTNNKNRIPLHIKAYLCVHNSITKLIIVSSVLSMWLRRNARI